MQGMKEHQLHALVLMLRCDIFDRGYKVRTHDDPSRGVLCISVTDEGGFVARAEYDLCGDPDEEWPRVIDSLRDAFQTPSHWMAL